MPASPEAGSSAVSGFAPGEVRSHPGTAQRLNPLEEAAWHQAYGLPFSFAFAQLGVGAQPGDVGSHHVVCAAWL